MPAKWQIEELTIGAVMEATFWQSPVAEWEGVKGAVWSVLSRALREAGSPARS